MAQRSESVRLQQTSQRFTDALAARIASAKSRATSGGIETTWNASRWADFRPMPGSL